MSQHELEQVIAAADLAITREDFDDLMRFYTEDATLVVRPGLNVKGASQIRSAFDAIAKYFNHSLEVTQGDMQVFASDDTALVVARTLLNAKLESGAPWSEERLATYVFRRDAAGAWRCAVDNSYGTDLLNPAPVLHLVCGKIGSGKSTLAQQLARSAKTVLISEDAWLAKLYPGAILTLADYVRCTGLLRSVLDQHIQDLLRAGLSVVLDFPANTPASRQWAKAIFEACGAAHQLHYLEVSDELCKARLHARNQSGTHPYEVSDTEYDLITSYFVPPADEEGFVLLLH